jgi:hypothetical protein
MLPRIASAGRATRTLNVLLAHPKLEANQINALAQLQLLRYYFDELRNDVDLHLNLLVTASSTALLRRFNYLGVQYTVVDDFNVDVSADVLDVARRLDCGVVLVPDRAVAVERTTDDFTMVTDDVAVVLQEAELHAKGFDAPWSFEQPVVFAPWNTFYMMYEHSIFADLTEDFNDSKAASQDVYEAMRQLIQSLQMICYCRDRMAFYRQQDRWASRAGLERQEFEFEYAVYLNLLYLGLYSVVDQVCGLIVRRFGLEVEKQNIGATYSAFRKELRKIPQVEALFTEAKFVKWYTRVKYLRLGAAHNGFLTPQTVYFGDDNFTDDQLLAKASELGYLDGLEHLPELVRPFVVDMAKFKAKLKLLDAPLRHVLFVEEGGKTYGYNPDPHAELKVFLGFFEAVRELSKPWDANLKPPEAEENG